jgi:hypothetical protein
MIRARERPPSDVEPAFCVNIGRMRSFTMLLSDPRQGPVALDAFGWQIDASRAASPVPQLPAHELSHTVQQSGRVRAWLVPKRTPTTQPTAAPTRGYDLSHRLARGPRALPEVGDEILVAFEHGDARAVSVYFNPKEITVSKAALARLDLGSVARGALRLVVRRRGTEPLFIATSSSVPGQIGEIGLARVL